jgi:ABC-2 type transport system ATP-binding protein
MQAVTGPLLEASAVRIDIDGASVVDGLSFASDGALILVQGAPRALFEAVCGIRSVARGTLRVLGQAPGRAAGAPLDPPIPAAWTARDYVLWSARLAGNKEAKEATERAMQALGLLAVARTRLGKLARVVRRAVVVASALATGAEVLVL